MEERMQSSYDAPKPESRVMAKLWRTAQVVRATLDASGSHQACLERKTGALQVAGVIYAIWCGRKVYVGQTIRSPLQRFRDHWYEAHNTNAKTYNTPLHREMRRLTVDQFSVFPLEVIPATEYTTRNGKKNAEKFRAYATSREVFWIERLHSYQSEIGYNVALVTGRKGRRHRRHNPMKYHRKRAEANQDQMDEKHVSRPSVAFTDATPIPQTQTPAVEGKSQEDAENVLPEGRMFGYRNYLRRCQYLAHRYEIGKLEQVRLSRYSAIVVKRMLRLLNYGLVPEDAISPEAKRAVLEFLRKFLKARTLTLRKKETSRSVLVLNWTSKLLQHVPLRAIMSKHRKLLPSGTRECIDDVVVARKLGDPISRVVFNYAPVARHAADEQSVAELADNQSVCPCHSLFHEKFRPNGGCVLTGNLDLVANAELRTLLSFGPRFRLRVISSPYERVKEALSAFIAKQDVHEAQFAEWLHAVLKECKACLKRACSMVLPRAERSVEMSRSAAKYLKYLQHYLVLVPADKAANNVTFVCKRHYCAELVKEFNTSGAYTNVQSTPEEVIAEHKAFMGTRQLLTAEKLPYLYWLPKLHKVPIGKRFIAGSGACSTTELSRLLSSVLTQVLHALREKDNNSIARTEIRRFFVVQGYEEVADFLHRFPRSDAADEERILCTGDFSTMYTTIPHEDLLERIQRVLEEAWAFRSEKEGVHTDKLFIQWSSFTGRASWMSGDDTRESHSTCFHTMSCESVMELTRFLVENTFLLNGGQLRRQVVGIPMGTNCAPALANLYLYSYECEFMDRIVISHGAEYARSFHESYRFIDDTLSVHNPHWREWVSVPADEGGIYPRELTLNDTTVSETRVHFLGMEIEDPRREDGKLVVNVFDKRKEFPFSVRRYPHTCSVIPRSIPYGVFTGQLHRFSRICSDARSFVHNAVFVAQTLRAQGCSTRVLRRKFHAFVSARAADRWNSTVSSLCKAFNRSLA